MSLNQYFWANKDRPIRKWAHYLPIYERYFSPWVNRHMVMLEIGTGNGGSAQMWKRFFGPAARIVSVDVRPECKQFEDEQIAVRIGSQDDPALLQSIIDEFGQPDIVLDDGSHVMAHILRTFDYLFPRLPKDAVYFVEDLHTAYWPSHGGGLHKSDTFIERVKNYIDEIHAQYTSGELQASEVGGLVRGLHVYDSIVVVEKGPFVNKSDQFIPNDPDAIRW
jgi:cephalosporin hydroxylase